MSKTTAPESRFRTRVRALRGASGLSASDLAQIAGLSVQRLDEIESSARPVTLDEACVLSEALRLSLIALVGENTTSVEQAIAEAVRTRSIRRVEDEIRDLQATVA